MNKRETTFKIIQAALRAVDPQTAVKAHLRRDGNLLQCGPKTYDLHAFHRVRIIGFGKGSAPMVQAVHELLHDVITDGLVIVKYEHTLPPEIDVSPVRIVEAGHPVPDENGLTQTKALIQLLQDSTEQDLILCLVSGGGSALLTQPASGLTLSQMQSTTQRLLEAGADITEINTIRKHLSAIKGGWLAKYAMPATILSLILSDVQGDQLDMIASGPTEPDSTTYADALALLEKYHLTDRLEPIVLDHIKQGIAGEIPETPKKGDPAFSRVNNVIISNNQAAVQAAVQAAQSLSFNAASFDTFIEGEASHVAKRVANLAKILSGNADLIQKPALLVFGGETTVTMGADHGLGGRNQELALAAAIELQGEPALTIAFVATDGNDGPTDAAGALIDGDTIARAKQAGLDPATYLTHHDSYHFFQALEGLIITGPTNTNVNDLILLIAWS
ncbi:MAG: glycerate kinase [Chloroflexota bacterium]